MPCQMTKGVGCCPSISTHKAATTTSLARFFIVNVTPQNAYVYISRIYEVLQLRGNLFIFRTGI